ncbi:MAG: hypothetical protein J0L92_18795 [Deltaproteobacteria bacterium]|nr:hypothetical protein [Deltaproteobacteria bacterium]
MKAVAKATKQPTKAQARAWLQTVLLPLSRMASVTRNRLEQGSLTYRQHLQGFELLGSSASAISPTVRLNFEQAARYLPELRDLVRAYDDALVTLRDACREAERVLVAHTAMAAAVASAERDVTDLPRYLAEYTINGLVELPSGYSLRELWAREGASLLALRARELAKEFDAIDVARSAATDAAVALDDSLRETMLALADRHGLPVIDLEIAS